ncbi:hypothetical protein [Candidatus Leptofilum sp.]|uniref:hypothetical protein n=1 Tax=Candidatus Leptofilum sp. TaxID=3241576 RepID=UPI003B5B9F8E
MKKRVQRLAIFLLIVGLSGCGLGKFNADGFEASEFTFEHPLGWEVIYDSKSTWVLQDIGTISVDENDDFTGFSPSTVGIGFQIYNQEELIGKTPLEILVNRELLINEAWAAFEESDEDRGVQFNVDGLPPSVNYYPKMIQSPSIIQICDKEVTVMEFEFFMSNDPPIPFLNKYEAFAVIDNQFIQIDAFPAYTDKEELDHVFEGVICSLEVHESE